MSTLEELDFERTSRIYTHHVKQDSVGVESMDVGLHDESAEERVLRDEFESGLAQPW